MSKHAGNKEMKRTTILFALCALTLLCAGVLLYKHVNRKVIMPEQKDMITTQPAIYSTKMVTVNPDIELHTESFGKAENPAILLISGAMTPARFWIDDFCQSLVDSGYFVIRYDHRDMGLSSAVDYKQNPYTLDTLAQDAIAILDAYSIQQAHVMGSSMGGAITQLLALDYPSRMLSITPISSAVLVPDNKIKYTLWEKATLAQTWYMLTKNKPTILYESSVDGFLKSYTYLHGDIPLDQTIAKSFIKDMYERSRPEHIAWFAQFTAGTEPMHNHVKAMQTVTDRRDDLKKLQIPVFAIHGSKDPLAFARVMQEYCIDVIPNATMHIVPGMGHMQLNKDLFMQIKDLWVKNIWLAYIKNLTANKKTGLLTAQDKANTPIELEWTITDTNSPNFSSIMQNISDLVAQAFTPVEVNFLKANAKDQKIITEYITLLDPIFTNNDDLKVDWEIVKQNIPNGNWNIIEEKMQQVIKKWQRMDAKNTQNINLYCFILAKDTVSKNLLGYTIFCIKPEYPFSNIQVTEIGIDPSAQNRGIGKLLMSSIFKIIPNIQRIFLSTRPTNSAAITAYHHWGFTEDSNPLSEPYMPINKKHWVYLEYKTTQQHSLQDLAEKIK
jgi:pimeloyl-ACP methyl ester carboxylesterase/GNAT superfamily N-acetyltransferase